MAIIALKDVAPGIPAALVDHDPGSTPTDLPSGYIIYSTSTGKWYSKRSSGNTTDVSFLENVEGSTVVIEENGSPISNTPHSIINFGSGINVADAGSGRATVTVPAESAFGANFQYVESRGLSSTTSTAWQNKLSLTTPSGLTGTYRVAFSARVYQGGVADRVQCRLYNSTDVDDLCGFLDFEPEDNDDKFYATGFAYVTFSGAAKTFVIQWRQQDGNVAYIDNARIEFWRVS